jgi:catechol 2,3-dioxygenase-like lactoylglutathione lyase family enzyme
MNRAPLKSGAFFLLYFDLDKTVLQMQNTFPESGMALTHILVVGDIEKSKKFYLDVLGAEFYSEYGGTSVVVKFLGNWLLLVTGGDPTPDKPGISFSADKQERSVNHSFTIRVENCQRSYEVLKSRGAEFLTPPHDWGFEIRSFFRDPDGHLFEISEIPGRKTSSE